MFQNMKFFLNTVDEHSTAFHTDSGGLKHDHSQYKSLRSLSFDSTNFAMFQEESLNLLMAIKLYLFPGG
jgi:hypothetical protein